MCDSNPKYPSTILSVTEFRCSGFAKLAPEYKAFALFLWRTISIGATSVVVVRVDVISREWETKETRAVRHENVGAVQEGTEQIWMRVLECQRTNNVHDVQERMKHDPIKDDVIVTQQATL